MSTKDWLEKDYYKILGVPKDAKPDQVKKAFRKIARENHPDQHPGDRAAEQRFKEASEAHDVLSDPDKRREYDEQRSLFERGTWERTAMVQSHFWLGLVVLALVLPRLLLRLRRGAPPITPAQSGPCTVTCTAVEMVVAPWLSVATQVIEYVPAATLLHT